MGGDVPRAAKAGFTLVEMLIVLAIMAIIMAWGVTHLVGAQSKADLEVGQRDIEAALRDARDEAILHGHQNAFTLDTAHGSFQTGATTPWRSLPRGVRTSLLTTTQERVNDAVGRIQFFADGSSTGGGVSLADDKWQSDVHVDWLTGRISATGIFTAGR